MGEGAGMGAGPGTGGAGTGGTAVAEEVAGAVSSHLGARVRVDPAWRPAVQGAVGHVLGLRGAGGEPYVAKVYAPGAHRAAATEVRALRLAAGALGAVVPAVVDAGDLPATGRPYVVLTRIAGRRWADRFADLTPPEEAALLAEVASVLRRLHTVRGPAFGSLVEGGRSWSSAPGYLAHLAATAVAGHRGVGGAADLADGVRHLVEASLGAVERVAPVLCHHDLNGGNVLVAADGPPRVTGVVDLERASWDDPVRDLALTALHVRQQDPAKVDVLLAAYGPLDAGGRVRLRVHTALLAMAERTWVVTDRPAGWERSAAALVDVVRACVGPPGARSAPSTVAAAGGHWPEREGGGR